MLNNITEPFDDEIFYSWFCRYHLLSGNINSTYTDMDFFGIKTYNKNISYPCNLNYLCSQLPFTFNISYDSIINNNTCFPIFKPFLKKSFSNYLLELMKYGTTTPKSNIRKISSLFNNKIIKICNQCILEDKKNYGISYIHRIHQIPGCFICQHHHIPLEYIDLSGKSYINNYYSILDNIIKLKIPFKLDNKIHNDLYELQSDAINFLKFNINDYTVEKVIAKYKQKLICDGYSTIKGVIRYEDLSNNFLNFYSKDLLDFFNLNISLNTLPSQNPLCNLVRNSSTKFNPIKHFLFIKFLFGSVENFINAPEEFLPFGVGPWPCLNSAATHYKENIIPSYELRKSTLDNNLFGVFECKCGFVYTRSLPEKGNDDRYNKRSVLNRGEEWEIKATELIISENYTLKNLALLLNCSTGKVISHAIKNKLLHHIETKKKYRKIKDKFQSSQNLLDEYKQKITQFISEHPDMSRSKIAKVLVEECKSVLRKDKEWYDKNMPPKLIPCNNNNYVDWHERDLETSKLVQVAIKEIEENTDLKLSKQNIAKKTGLTFIVESRSQSKMPITQKIIVDSKETKEEYIKRKTEFTIMNLKREK